MRFNKLDLNLLVALDALLTEKSVSLAADRICLSQSATSSALGRLRDYFGDDLLVVRGRQMSLTPRGETLREPVRKVLTQIHASIAVAPPFEPEISDRTIRIVASDYTIEVFLAAAIGAICAAAPNMRFEVQSLTDTIVETLERGQADLLISIESSISPDHPSELLFDDDYVVAGWAGNPHLIGSMTVELYSSLEHVTSAFGRSRLPSFEEAYLRDRQLQRKVAVVTPSFVGVAGFLLNSNRIATMHRRLARKLAQYLPLRFVELPFEMPGISERVQWERASSSDPAIRWIIGQLTSLARKEGTLSDELAEANPAPVAKRGTPYARPALRAVPATARSVRVQRAADRN